MLWIFLFFIVILIIACFTAWHFAEHHELHKVRAEFEKYLRYTSYKDKYYEGIKRAEKIINIMDEDFYGNYHKPNDN